MATGQNHLNRRAKHSSIKYRGDQDLPRPFVNDSKDKRKNQYQLNRRARHSSIVIKDSLYCRGGDENDLPRPFVNNSKDKRKSASTVDIFHLPSFDLERASITGNLPEGVMGYACTSIENNVLYFGGSCKPLDCYHNSLHQLNSLTNNWEEIVSISPDNEPMRKRGCGMITFNTNGECNLLVLGGFGPTPITTAVNFQYVPHPNYPNLTITNEMHVMCVSSSPGQWEIPDVTGTRPPPCAYFTSSTLPGNRGVMFGGIVVDETGKHRVNDLFLFTCLRDTIDFRNVVKSPDTTVKWPKERSFHGSAIIITISSNGKVTSHLIQIGGLDCNGDPISDCWIIDLQSLILYQVP